MTSSADARELLRQGRLDEAERAFEQILERSPEDIEALNVIALAALRDGKPSRALQLLQRAEAVKPSTALTQYHLGLVHEATGDIRAAVMAHQAAVTLEPTLHVARLHYAVSLERSGDLVGAVVQFARALQDAQAKGRWLNAATTPAALQPIVQHAVRTVRTRRREALFRLLAPLAQRYGASSLARIEQCLRIYLNEETPAYPDPRQKPSFLYFPGLPPSPYIDRSLFPWIEALEAQTDTIRSELLRLLPSDQGRERVFTSDELESQNLRGLDVSPTWNGYYFYRHGVRRDDNCASCPATTRALETLPLVHVREHGPEVLFSVFTPGTHLLPHRGVTNTRLVGHLPLIVPADCALNVGGELHEWKEGQVVVFDDTYEHEAWNRSGQTRVVLIFDIWNPHLTEVERAAVTDIVVAIGEFRHAMEAA